MRRRCLYWHAVANEFGIDLDRARAFQTDKERRRRARIDARFEQATRDASAIVAAIAEQVNPRRIYQWGSLLDRSRFSEISDLDFAIEGISQHFENRLGSDRWHTDLLQKMTLEIKGVRVAAVSEAAFPPLLQLLQFRHFKRNYFELEPDWDRLDFLVGKLRQAHPLVTRDLERFGRFMSALDQS